MPFVLPDFSYLIDALEPYTSKGKMETYQGKHHQAYVTNFNAQVEVIKFDGKTLEELSKIDTNILNTKNMPFVLPELTYAVDALEPYIDKMTMEIHHGKHHQAYVTNLNAAIKGTEMEGKTLEELFHNISKYPVAVRNNGGGHYAHTMFWQVIAPCREANALRSCSPTGKMIALINETFGSFEAFQEKFSAAAMTRFGSGWAWLIVNKDGKLEICSTPNQDNPLMDIAEVKGTPILGIDVWEHAYYLQYQNRRAEYVANFFNVINWKVVAEFYDKAVAGK
jgi:Fe-Mn family superoxide dismutase